MQMTELQQLDHQYGPFSIPIKLRSGDEQEVRIQMHASDDRTKVYNVITLNGEAERGSPLVHLQSSGIGHALREVDSGSNDQLEEAEEMLLTGTAPIAYEWQQGGHPSKVLDEFVRMTGEKLNGGHKDHLKTPPVEMGLRLPSREIVRFRVSMASFDNASRVYSVISKGDLSSVDTVNLRLVSACSYGHALRSVLCDCNKQWEQVMQMIAEMEVGVAIYGWHDEGRGAGHVDHFRAYEKHQLEGLDSVEAYEALGLTVDARNYDDEVQMLEAMRINRVRLMTNNPKKAEGLTSTSVQVVETIPVRVPVDKWNERQIRVRREKLGHDY